MRFLLENARYVVVLAVFATMIGSISVFLWTVASMGYVVYDMMINITSLHREEHLVHLVAILDMFLLAVILYIFAIALYELFIEDVRVPKWLDIRTLDDLKIKLSSVLTLMLAVTFLEHVVKWQDPQGTLMFATAIALIIGSMVFYIKTKGTKA